MYAPIIGLEAHAFAQAIVRDEAKKYGATPQEVLGPGREVNIVAARHHAIARIYTSGWAQWRIARFFHRDHSTIMHTLRKMGVYQRKAGG